MPVFRRTLEFRGREHRNLCFIYSFFSWRLRQEIPSLAGVLKKSLSFKAENIKTIAAIDDFVKSPSSGTYQSSFFAYPSCKTFPGKVLQRLHHDRANTKHHLGGFSFVIIYHLFFSLLVCSTEPFSFPSSVVVFPVPFRCFREVPLWH